MYINIYQYLHKCEDMTSNNISMIIIDTEKKGWYLVNFSTRFIFKIFMDIGCTQCSCCHN
jgi:hypothetical protein